MQDDLWSASLNGLLDTPRCRLPCLLRGHGLLVPPEMLDQLRLNMSPLDIWRGSLDDGRVKVLVYMLVNLLPCGGEVVEGPFDLSQHAGHLVGGVFPLVQSLPLLGHLCDLTIEDLVLCRHHLLVGGVEAGRCC